MALVTFSESSCFCEKVTLFCRKMKSFVTHPYMDKIPFSVIMTLISFKQTARDSCNIVFTIFKSPSYFQKPSVAVKFEVHSTANRLKAENDSVTHESPERLKTIAKNSFCMETQNSTQKGANKWYLKNKCRNSTLK